MPPQDRLLACRHDRGCNPSSGNNIIISVSYVGNRVIPLEQSTDVSPIISSAGMIVEPVQEPVKEIGGK